MKIIELLSSYALPVVLLLILFSGVAKDIKVYDAFVEGAREGLDTLIRILPSLIGLMVAVGVFRASGAMDLLIYAAGPVLSAVGVPPEVLPLAFLRPVSGSASLALVADIMKQYGPDSLPGKTASVMMGSTETIFYTLTVYYGSVGVKDIRFALWAALIADTASVLVSSWICTLLR